MIMNFDAMTNDELINYLKEHWFLLTDTEKNILQSITNKQNRG